MASSKGTFNDYLFTVERLRRTGIPRPDPDGEGGVYWWA